MSDTIDDYKALAEFRKQERAERRAAAEAKLQGLNYSVHNGGAHIVIWEGGAIFDFWPGTDRWRMRDHKGQFGFDKMLAAIRQRRVVALDLAEIELRVAAHMGVNETLDHYGTLAYVDKMEKAYPHLKGEDE